MIKIYKIEDSDGLKYVGQTSQKLSYRLQQHTTQKRFYSSSRLDLDDCFITCLDVADSKEEANELEIFYIQSIDCVNELKYQGLDIEKRKKYRIDYRENNKDKMKEYDKNNRERRRLWEAEYRKKNRDKINQRQKEKYHASRSLTD